MQKISLRFKIIITIFVLILMVVILGEKLLNDSNSQVYSNSQLHPPALRSLSSKCQDTVKQSLGASDFTIRQFEPGLRLYKLMKKRKIYEVEMEKCIRNTWLHLRSLEEQTTSTASFIDTVQSMQNPHSLMQMWYDQIIAVNAIQSNFKHWQQNISSELQLLMQKRLHHLQNPKDCNSARKVVCEVKEHRYCGFGCQMHYIGLCFILAYASERTLVFEGHSTDWLTGYDTRGWNAIFQPISPCRPSGDPGSRKEWTLTSTENTVILPPYPDRTSNPPQGTQMAVPKDIADRLAAFHGFPFVWFVSQFMHYLMRPAPELEKYLKEREDKLGLSSSNRPIVGVHVRHTDKYHEAPLYNLSAYMQHVEEWYDWYDLTHDEKVKRRVFIATDDTKVLEEAKNKYHKYEVLSDSKIASLADTKTRYSQDSLFGAISDVNVLSKCDYIVLTLSSTMGRLVYALMQWYHVDASHLHYSVDGVYLYHGMSGTNVERELASKKPVEVADFPTYNDVY